VVAVRHRVDQRFAQCRGLILVQSHVFRPTTRWG
jgi:hypothetical protein